jgi:hypothetical protein
MEPKPHPIPMVYHLYDVPPPPDLANAGWTERLRWCVAVIDPEPRERELLKMAASLLVRSIYPGTLSAQEVEQASGIDGYLRTKYAQRELLFQMINALDDDQ